MRRGLLLLPCLALAAWANAAGADEMPRPQRSAPAKSSQLSPAAPLLAGEALNPMPGMRIDREVAPAGYVARDEFPQEPLGFSAARFNPRGGAIVDPGTAPGVSYGPYKSGNFEFYEDGDGEALATSSGEWIRNGCWYADVGVTYLSRSVGIRNNGTLAAEVFSSNNVLALQQDLGFQPALDLTVGRYLGRDIRNRDHSVEFSFLGLGHWQYAQSISAVNNFIFQEVDPSVTVPVFDRSLFQSADLTSDFNSYEFNYRIDRRLGRDRMVYSRDNVWVREATPGWVVSMIPGVRTVIVNERLSWFAQNASGIGQYTVQTHNNLVGPQIAGEMAYEYAYWRLGARLKGGALVNWNSQSTAVRIVDNEGDPLSPLRNEFSKDHSLAFVGGVTVMGEYRFRPNFGVKAAYDIFWATGLALAEDQLTFVPSTPADLSSSHGLLFNGFTLGLEWYR